jgi:hypothetical protein
MSETEPSPILPPQPMPELQPGLSRTRPVDVTPPVVKPHRSIWPLLGIIGFLLLAAGEGYLYRLHQLIPDNSTAIAVLQAQVTGLQEYANRAQPAPDSVTVQADLTQKIANLNAAVTVLQTQSAADHASIATLAANSTDLTTLTAKMTLLNRLETARMALDGGQPVGNIPNAPPALALYATTKPPTEASLVLSFPAAARQANLVSVQRVEGKSLWTRILARMEGLVTITNGAHVVVGAPASAITTQAQALLDAGDLGGAVTVLDGLSPETQAAMGNWLPQARNLLAARAALISMAGQS